MSRLCLTLSRMNPNQGAERGVEREACGKVKENPQSYCLTPWVGIYPVGTFLGWIYCLHNVLGARRRGRYGSAPVCGTCLSSLCPGSPFFASSTEREMNQFF